MMHLGTMRPSVEDRNLTGNARAKGRHKASTPAKMGKLLYINYAVSLFMLSRKKQHIGPCHSHKLP